MNRNAATRQGELLRGALAALGLVGLTMGVPAALAALAGWPLPRGLPGWERIGSVLASRAELPVATLLKAVALIGWLAWAELILAVAAEVAAQVRGRGARTLPLPLAGAVQAAAGRLVATALLVMGPLSGARTQAATPPLRAVAAVATAPDSAPPCPAPLPSVGAPTDLAPGTRTYTVHPGDWLSKIARDHLGAWQRYPEVSALNQGRPQPDGGALVDDDLIRPGWELVMPSDANGVDVVPASPLEPAAPDPLLALPEDAAPGMEKEAQAAPSPAAVPEPTPDAVPAPTPPAPRATPGTGGAPHAAPVPLRTLAFALPALLGGVGVFRLRRLRANQQRQRRRGRDLPRPVPALREAEVRIRAVADEDAAAWVDATVRHLWRALQTADLPEVPAVLALRAGAMGVELLLDRPAPAAPEGLVPKDHDRVWRLDPDLDLARLQELANDESPALPALLTVGETPEGALLIDLERAGTLAVDGDPERVGAFLAAAALELASAPWAEDVSVILVGGDRNLAALEPVVLADADEAIRRLFGRSEHPSEGRHRLAARLSPPALEGLAPIAVVVASGATTAEHIERLAAAARPDSGAVLVAPGPVPGASWCLRLEEGGTATLEPLGMRIRSAVDVEAVDDLTALLVQATSGDDVALVAGLPGPDREDEGPLPGVRILGPVEIDWVEPPPRSRAAELVAYLATRDHPVQGDRIKVDLWPEPRGDEVADSTFRSTVSRARTALGSDADGRPHLREAKGGCFRLGEGITSDWRRFRHLAARAGAAPATEALEFYRAALRMVRSAPFANAAKGAYGWVDADGLRWEIEVGVVEAAERMGDLALDAGEPKLAEWAARRALRVCPARESLYQFLMRAAAQQGDPESVERAWREVRLAIRALGVLEEPHADTVALYESLRSSASSATAARASGE